MCLNSDTKCFPYAYCARVFEAYLCITNIIIHDTVSGLISELNVFRIYHLKVPRSIISQVPSFQISILCSQWIEDNRKHPLPDARKMGVMVGEHLLLKQREPYWYSLSFNFSQALLVYGGKCNIQPHSTHCCIINTKEMLSRRQCSKIAKSTRLGLPVLQLLS